MTPLALPAPPHGRAAAPSSGMKKRVLNNQLYDVGQLNESRTAPGVFTKDPMVVMDRQERNRYLPISQNILLFSGILFLVFSRLLITRYVSYCLGNFITFPLLPLKLWVCCWVFWHPDHLFILLKFYFLIHGCRKKFSIAYCVILIIFPSVFCKSLQFEYSDCQIKLQRILTISDTWLVCLPLFIVVVVDWFVAT